MVVLHLCSGRRREGDAHFSLDQFMGDVGRGRCVSIVMVSVDVTIDPARGTLASVEALRVRVDMVVDRRVVGLLGGPPCETWPKARGSGDGGRPGPPIVRSAEEPRWPHGPAEEQHGQP